MSRRFIISAQQIFVGIVVVALMGVTLYETFDLLERVFCRWSQI